MVFFCERSRTWVLLGVVKLLLVKVSAVDSWIRKPARFSRCSFCHCSQVFSETSWTPELVYRTQTQHHVVLPNEQEQTFYDAVVPCNDDENGLESIGRRDMMFLLFGGASAFVTQSSLAATPLAAIAAANNTPKRTVDVSSTENLYSHPNAVTPNMINSLVFERVLGTGSYKIVYLVSTTTTETPPTQDSIRDANQDISQSTGLSLPPNNTKHRYALAVERLTTKRSVKDGIRGIRMAQFMQEQLTDVEDQKRFEQIDEWWFQSTNVADYEVGAIGQQRVFPSTLVVERTQTIPRRFLGSKYLMALKPLYAMDLKSLVQKVPTLYPVVDEAASVQKFPSPQTIAGITLTEQSALDLAYELCYSGNLMHSLGIVHRDIKPKNIMLTFEGKPVIIDFGFAQMGNPIKTTSTDRVCVVNQGQNKGEVRYVLAQDVAQYRGCQEGDVYAMGKTLFEILFGEATPAQQSSGKLAITPEDAKLYNDDFRSMLMDDNDQSQRRVCRFYPMSREVYDILLNVIRGMCRFDNPDSFAEASKTLLFALRSTSYYREKDSGPNIQ